MTMKPSMQLQPGMQVIGTDMDSVGTIKEVRTNDFLVDRRMQRDIYVPYSAIQNVSANQVVLNIVASQVDNMGWPRPPTT